MSHRMACIHYAVIRHPKFQTILPRIRTDPRRMPRELRLLAEIMEPLPLAAPVSRDRADDKVLAPAIAA
jgi:hypothetical protein